MKYYEILYIVHPALEGGHLQDIVKSVDGLIEKNKGKIESNSDWGKKKLAYPIEKQKYGSYVLVQFNSNGLENDKILKDLEHNPNILAYLLSNIEKSDIILESKEEAPAEEAPAEEAPAEEAPAEEAPAEEAPAEEAPAEEAPAEEAPAEEAPAEEATNSKDNEEEK